MASRPSMARANFEKYKEITNPLAGDSKGKKDASNGSSGRGQSPEEQGDSDIEEDPFGLGSIMAEDEEPKGAKKDGKGQQEEDEDEDPFGLGAIMTSDTSTLKEDPSKSNDVAGSGGDDDRSNKILAGRTKRIGATPSLSTSKPAKSQRTGGYFSEGHVNSSSSRPEEPQQPTRPFLPSKRFDGARPGYVFQLGKSGLGYYMDKRARAVVGRRAAAKVGAPTRGGPEGATCRAGGSAGSEARPANARGQQQARPAVDVTAAAQKLGSLLLKPKKTAKAASLMADLMQAEMRAENARLFYRALRPLAEQPGSESALAGGEGAARAFRLLMEKQEWVGGAVEGVRTVTWELLFGLRHEVKTDDSFQFARAVKRLRSAIEALGDVTGGGGSGSDQRDAEDTAEAAGAGQSLTLSLERKRAVIEIMKETIKSYHLAWARSSIEPAFKAAADRRRLFPEGELRDTLDGFTDTITKRQRNPGGLMAPPARTVRAHNSTAHPMLNKRSDIIR